MATITYSQRLGAISDEQLDTAAQRLNIGRFVAAAPIHKGLFGQNLFLTTTEGAFVLRGAPHWVNGVQNDQWQFTKETFFARLLHEHTDVPVPWPPRLDPASDIFGWPYLIVPRLAGISLDEHAVRKTFTPGDQRALAQALGRGLARMQVLHWPMAGDVGMDGHFQAYPDGYVHHLSVELQEMQDWTKGHGALTPQDEHLIGNAIDQAARQTDAEVETTYVHADYKLDNLMVTDHSGSWEVCGVFDLHTSCFGDAAYDLCRTACAYLDRDVDLARAFVDAWCDTSGTRDINRPRLRLYLLNERMKLWSYFTQPAHRAEWTRATTFSGFVSRYAQTLEHLVT